MSGSFFVGVADVIAVKMAPDESVTVVIVNEVEVEVKATLQRLRSSSQ
jgi:hypothetical protein